MDFNLNIISWNNEPVTKIYNLDLRWFPLRHDLNLYDLRRIVVVSVVNLFNEINLLVKYKNFIIFIE